MNMLGSLSKQYAASVVCLWRVPSNPLTGGWDTAADSKLAQAPAAGSGHESGSQSARHRRAAAVQTQDLASSVAAVRSAGDLFPGDKLACVLLEV